MSVAGCKGPSALTRSSSRRRLPRWLHLPRWLYRPPPAACATSHSGFVAAAAASGAAAAIALLFAFILFLCKRRRTAARPAGGSGRRPLYRRASASTKLLELIHQTAGRDESFPAKRLRREWGGGFTKGVLATAKDSLFSLAPWRQSSRPHLPPGFEDAALSALQQRPGAADAFEALLRRLPAPSAEALGRLRRCILDLVVESDTADSDTRLLFGAADCLARLHTAYLVPRHYQTLSLRMFSAGSECRCHQATS